jgi:hypothetical protein
MPAPSGVKLHLLRREFRLLVALDLKQIIPALEADE